VQLIEQWGSGVRRIFQEAQEFSLPEPEIVEIGMRLQFTVWLSESITPKQTTSIPQVMRIIQATSSGAMTKAELMETLGLKDRKHFRISYLNPALKENVIEMTQPESPAYSV
jgi:ATP-dependent DNA helicase RecG